MVDRSHNPKKKLPVREASNLYDSYSSSQVSVPSPISRNMKVDDCTRIQDLGTLSTHGTIKKRSIDNSAVVRSLERLPKRRKMSAAEKHVDVGVATTDEDSS